MRITFEEQKPLHIMIRVVSLFNTYNALTQITEGMSKYRVLQQNKLHYSEKCWCILYMLRETKIRM